MESTFHFGQGLKSTEQYQLTIVPHGLEPAATVKQAKGTKTQIPTGFRTQSLDATQALSEYYASATDSSGLPSLRRPREKSLGRRV